MLVIFSVIPATVINHLSKDLDWWLSSVLLKFWHVQVIDIDNTASSEPWSKSISSPLFNLHIDNILNHVAMGLSGKADLDDEPLALLQFLVENILNVLGLACSCWSDKERSNVV